MRDIGLRGCPLFGLYLGQKQGVIRKAHGQVQMAVGGGKVRVDMKETMSVNRWLYRMGRPLDWKIYCCCSCSSPMCSWYLSMQLIRWPGLQWAWPLSWKVSPSIEDVIVAWSLSTNADEECREKVQRRVAWSVTEVVEHTWVGCRRLVWHYLRLALSIGYVHQVLSKEGFIRVYSKTWFK